MSQEFRKSGPIESIGGLWTGRPVELKDLIWQMASLAVHVNLKTVLVIIF
jgi:hypothetical protein